MKKKYDISREEIKHLLTDGSETRTDMLNIDQTEDALVKFAKSHSIAPPPALRESVLGKISQLATQKKQQQRLDLANLPMLADNTNWHDWQQVVQGIEPPANFDNIHLHTIESNEKRELFVAWVKEMVEEEVHFDLIESFLILEGSCECHISNEKGETRIVCLGQGDHITMQLGETHDIIITSLQPAKAILEWRKLAA